MRTIKIKDLEIVEREKQNTEQSKRDTAKAIAELALDNSKKDIVINQLAQTVAKLNIEIQKLKEGN